MPTISCNTRSLTPFAVLKVPEDLVAHPTWNHEYEAKKTKSEVAEDAFYFELMPL